MGRYLVGRVSQAVIVVLLVSLGIFLLIRAVPGGPELILFPEMSLEQAKQMRRSLGLEEHPLIQYARWLTELTRGRLGTSYIYSMPVTGLLAERLAASLVLLGSAMGLAVALSMTLGVVAAVKRDSWFDDAVGAVSAVGLAIPAFWLGMVLIIVFAVILRWLPPGGTGTGSDVFAMERLRHLVLPCLVLTTLAFAELVRYVRSAVIAELESGYVTTAVSKGLGPGTVLLGHVMRNALIPIVTIVGLQMRTLVSGAAITETVFAWPGMGRLAYDAAFTRDYPVMMGVTLVVSVAVVCLNLVVDLIYAYVDPRIRYA